MHCSQGYTGLLDSMTRFGGRKQACYHHTRRNVPVLRNHTNRAPTGAVEVVYPPNSVHQATSAGGKPGAQHKSGKGGMSTLTGKAKKRAKSKMNYKGKRKRKMVEKAKLMEAELRQQTARKNTSGEKPSSGNDITSMGSYPELQLDQHTHSLFTQRQLVSAQADCAVGQSCQPHNLVWGSQDFIEPQVLAQVPPPLFTQSQSAACLEHATRQQTAQDDVEEHGDMDVGRSLQRRGHVNVEYDAHRGHHQGLRVAGQEHEELVSAVVAMCARQYGDVCCIDHGMFHA